MCEEHEVLTYTDFGVAVREVAQAIVDDGFVPDIIMCIARGVLPFARPHRPGASGLEQPRTLGPVADLVTSAAGPNVRGCEPGRVEAGWPTQSAAMMSCTRSLASPKSISELSRKNSGFWTPA